MWVGKGIWTASAHSKSATSSRWQSNDRPLKLTKASKACKNHHHCQLWRSYSSLLLEKDLHKTNSNAQAATASISKQELRRARGTRVVSPLLVGQGCVPSKLYSNTDSSHGFGYTASSLLCFSHFPQRKIHPSLHGSCCWLQWCARGDELLHMCKVLAVWNAHASSVVG